MSDRRRLAAISPYWVAFVLCAAASAVPFLVTYRVPMTDLPQHAAQLAIWKHYNDACYGFFRIFYKDWLTPYLLGYGIARLFAFVASINSALKLTAYIAVVALPLALRELTRRASLDDFLSLLGLPLAFGFSFGYGFLNFIVAIPIGILFVAWAFDYARRPTVKVGVALTLMSLLLLASHALVYALCLAIAVTMHLGSGQRIRSFAPYAVSVPLALLWVVRVRSREASVHAPPVWSGLLFRPANFPLNLLSSGWDPAALGFSLLFAFAAYLIGVRPAADRRRWIPLIIAAVCYFFLPSPAFGTAALYERFAVFCGSFALFALDRREPVVNATVARAWIVALILVWAGLMSLRFHAFGRDAANFDRIVDGIPANARVLFLDVDPGSVAVPGVPFLHFESYYQERRGGIVGRSFASHFPELIRYRPGNDPGTFLYLDWYPWMFQWGRDSNFDWFLVRAPGNLRQSLFAHAQEPLDLQGHFGMWWLYAKHKRPEPSQCAPFEPEDREATASERSPG